MSNIKIQLDLGRVDFSSLVTDDDFRLEAQRLLPAAIKKVGDGVGKVAWDKLQKAFRGPAFKPTSSVADKKKFIRETSSDYARGMTAADRRELVDYLVQKLREQKSTAD